MSDIVFESIRVVILLYVVFYLYQAGKKRRELCRPGWFFVRTGFALLLFGNVMDVTDNFDSLSRFIVIGDTPTQAFLEKMVGFMGGFLLLAIGLVKWIPTMTNVEHSEQVNEALAQEITKHKQAEESLRHANDIIVQSPVVAFIWKNAEGWPVEYVSENARDMFGWSTEDFVSGVVPYSSVVHPDDLERVGKEVSQANADLKLGTVTHAPYRIVTRDQQVKWIEDITTIRRAEDGSVVSYEGILLDITAHKQAEERLQAERDYSAHILNVTPAAICGIATDGICTFLNPAGERVTGYKQEEVVGKNWWETFCPGDDYEQVNQLFRDFEKGPVHGYEMTLTRKDGCKRTVAWNSVNKFNANGDLMEVIGFGYDVTEHNEQKKELAGTIAEMERMNRLMTGREERVIEMKKEVNALLAELAREAKYQSVVSDDEIAATGEIV